MTFNRFSFLALSIMLLTALATLAAPVQAAPNLPTPVPPTPSPTATVYSTPTPNAEMTLMFAQATDQALAIAKTEAQQISARQTQAAIDFANAVQMTNQAQAAADAATQIYWQGVTSTSVVSTVISYTATAGATQTQGAGAIATATQVYWAGATQTSVIATWQVERSARTARNVSIWSLALLVSIASLLGVLWLGVRVWRSWKMAQAEYLQASTMQPDSQGRMPLVPTDALGKNNKIVNPNLAHRAVIDPAEKDELTAEQALANKEQNNYLEATRAIANSPALTRRLINQKPPVTAETPLPEANLELSLPPLLTNGKPTADWRLVEGWDGQGAIPYGISARGLERLSLQQIPHGGIFGQTGKGKSRYFLRPFIAAALAAGQRVVILGKQADFYPFAEHPNVTMIPVRHITQADEASRYADYLKRMVEEMNRRDEYLAAHHVSTWDRAGRTNTLIILDELGNALEMMPNDVRQQAHRWVNGLVKEGRKTGFNVWLASQRAVGFKSIVEQLGRAVFYLSDAEASRYALGMPGAETLPEDRFFARFQGLHQCAAFDPSDEELASFLRSRPVAPHGPIDWIDVEATDVPALPLAPTETEIDQRIRQVLARMKEGGDVSLSRVQREVFGPDDPRGGKHFKRIQQVWIEMQAESATATRKDAPIGKFNGSDTRNAPGSAA